MKIVVIGAGIAGLSAALMAAQAGHRTTLVTKGLGGTGLSAGPADALGFTEGGAVTGNPFEALAELPAEHPYHQIGAENARAGLRWLADRLGDFFVDPQPSANSWLPTALGAARPTYLVPRSCEQAVLEDGRKYLVVGLREFKDFPAELIAANLNRNDRFSLSARAETLSLPGRAGEADVNGTDYARAFDGSANSGDLIARFAELINGHVREGETVLVPAIIGQRTETFREFASLVHAPVAEVPTAPPSIIGHRIGAALMDLCREARVDVRINSAAVAGVSREGRMVAVTATRAGGTGEIAADAVIDAAGGFASGNLTRDSHLELREPIFGLPLESPDPGSLRGLHEIDAENRRAVESVLMSGVRVDEQMRALGTEGAPAYENLYCAGDVLGGAAPWRELSGEGIALGSVYAAVQAIGAASANGRSEQ